MKTSSTESSARPRARAAKSRTAKVSAASTSIFAEVKREHTSFRKVMTRIRKLYPSDPERAKVAYTEFRMKFHAHSEALEESLYGYLLGKTKPGEKLDDQVREEKEEHHLAELLMNELTQIPAADPKWKAKFRVLQESIEHHLVKEEEFSRSWKAKLSRAEDRLVHGHFVSRRGTVLGQALALRH